MRNEHYAKVAYHAYGATTNHKNFRGEPMPAWPDLPGAIQLAWRAAAEAVIDALRGPAAIQSEGGGA